MALHKKWLIKLLISFGMIFALLGIPIIGINYIADPLWVFDSSNEYNDVQQGFNERQQKVNRLTFSDKKYDALLLGSSRSTYINQHHFKNLKVFNLSVSSMYVDEYKDYIEYAKKKNGKQFDYIFLGLDFFAANKYRTESGNEQPKFYIDQANSYLYRMKMLASFDTLELSLPVLKSSLKNKPVFIDHRFYDRENVASPFPVTDELRNKRIETNIVQFYEKEEPYEYDPNIKKMLDDIVKSNPDTKFIVYTTPVTVPRLAVELENEDYMKGYEQWLTDIVDTFGKVHHFMNINEGTVQLENFSDSHHFIPSFGNKIVDQIWNKRGEELGLGVVLTKKNLDEEINRTEDDIQKNTDFAYEHLKPAGSDTVLYTDSFDNSIPVSSLGSGKETSKLYPLKLLGAKGTFNIVNQNDGLLIRPQQAGKQIALQIGYDLAELPDSKPAGNEVTFIVSLKGKTPKPGSVQLFIQDKVGGNWERTAYNTLPDEQHYRHFKVTKKIRPGAETILIGIKWTNITNQLEWLQVERIEVY